MSANIVLAAREHLGRPLIATHRGTSGGCVYPNTARAAALALASGSDIIELDTVRTTDGVYLTFHDGYEPQLLGIPATLGTLSAAEAGALMYGKTPDVEGVAHVETYESVLASIPGVLVNVDRSFRYWKDGFLTELATWADPRYMLVKSTIAQEYLQALAGCGIDYPYIPIVSSKEDIDTVLGWKGLNVVGLEVLARQDSDLLADPSYIAGLKEAGVAIWLNAMNLENGVPLYCGWDDVTSVFDDPDRGWGRLVEMGADIIQTDYPWLLRAYLDERAVA